MIPEEMLPALLGVLPSTLTTCSKSGKPNLTNIARVWYVDECHVGIANHMLNKSIANVRENPFVYFRLINPANFSTWDMEAEYIGSQTEGTIYEEMKKQNEILSMMAEHVFSFKVRSAEVFRVLSVRLCVEESMISVANPDTYNELLEALEKKWGWDKSAVWHVDKAQEDLGELSYKRGIGEVLNNQILHRVASWTLQNRKPIRIDNIRSQFKYALSATKQPQDDQHSPEVNQHYVAIPIIGENDRIVAVIGSQSDDHSRFALYDEEALEVVSRHISHILGTLGLVGEKECKQGIEQTLDRIFFEISKRKGEVSSPLSAREVQVAVLVARGLSNAEIAQSLFISKRTVTTHLERIFQKVGISSRAALAAYVLEQGLADEK
ncbi:LuxR C-terminal-related transcriptional regulator [Brevibacillus sp. SYSU BS000544]|uniref:LuxR C-terminal-related transcriptional regulator n=1 Tax=Brevibacillus sp. SYSU BS000544 TaxID=3416443 RepID=UPI003CE5087F